MEDEINSQMPDNFPNDMGNGESFKMPSLEQVMQMIEGIEGISDEERENIRMNFLEQQSQASELLKQRMVANQNVSGADYLVFVAMLTLIALVFVLFGYKLYKSLMEKERKREEKSKAKKSKKNK